MSEWKPYEIEDQARWRPDILDTDLPTPIRLLIRGIRKTQAAALSVAESIKRINDAFIAASLLAELQEKHAILEHRFQCWMDAKEIAHDVLSLENKRLQDQVDELELKREEYEAYCRELRQ